MKTSFFSMVVLTLALCVASTPSSWGDSVLQNGSPGAQGTQGTNPTHQDQSVTGPNGGHATDSNPASNPPPAHKKKHKKKVSTTSTNSTTASTTP